MRQQVCSSSEIIAGIKEALASFQWRRPTEHPTYFGEGPCYHQQAYFINTAIYLLMHAVMLCNHFAASHSHGPCKTPPAYPAAALQPAATRPAGARAHTFDVVHVVLMVDAIGGRPALDDARRVHLAVAPAAVHARARVQRQLHLPPARAALLARAIQTLAVRSPAHAYVIPVMLVWASGRWSKRMPVPRA